MGAPPGQVAAMHRPAQQGPHRIASQNWPGLHCVASWHPGSHRRGPAQVIGSVHPHTFPWPHSQSVEQVEGSGAHCDGQGGMPQ